MRRVSALSRWMLAGGHRCRPSHVSAALLPGLHLPLRGADHCATACRVRGLRQELSCQRLPVSTLFVRRARRALHAASQFSDSAIRRCPAHRAAISLRVCAAVIAAYIRSPAYFLCRPMCCTCTRCQLSQARRWPPPVPRGATSSRAITLKSEERHELETEIKRRQEPGGSVLNAAALAAPSSAVCTQIPGDFPGGLRPRAVLPAAIATIASRARPRSSRCTKAGPTRWPGPLRRIHHSRARSGAGRNTTLRRQHVHGDPSSASSDVFPTACA